MVIRSRRVTPTYTDIRLIAGMSKDGIARFARTIQESILSGKSSKCPEMMRGQLALLRYIVKTYGIDIECPIPLFGETATLPLKGFPEGKIKIKVRAGEFTTVYVKTEDAIFKYLPGTMAGYVVPIAVLSINKRGD